MPNGRCRMHGGKVPDGIAAPTFVHGRYSKVMPSDMLARYRDAQQDQELHSLAEEIRLSDMHSQELVEALAKAKGDKRALLWVELRTETNHRARLVERDTRRKQMLAQMIPVERVLAFAQAMAHSIRKNVLESTGLSDEQKVRNIQADMKALGV